MIHPRCSHRIILQLLHEGVISLCRRYPRCRQGRPSEFVQCVAPILAHKGVRVREGVVFTCVSTIMQNEGHDVAVHHGAQRRQELSTESNIPLYSTAAISLLADKEGRCSLVHRGLGHARGMNLGGVSTWCSDDELLNVHLIARPFPLAVQKRRPLIWMCVI